MIFLDTETYSETPLKHGTYRYAEGCEVMVLSWAVDDWPVNVLDLTRPSAELLLPAELFDDSQTIVAHNVAFDRNVLRLGSNTRLDIPRERWQCSMVRALAHGLPGSLDALCDLFKVPADKRKMKEGTDLVKLFCKPRPKNQKLRRATRETHPKEWAQFLAYAGRDVEAMRILWGALPSWNYPGADDRELRLHHLDQKINDRGFCLDHNLAEAAMRAADREKARLAAECDDQTGGEVEATTQRDRLLAHLLADYGVHLPDMRADTIERRLSDPDLPDGVKELLANRLQASSTSTAKYKAVLRAVNADGRVRGTIQFDGAARTRRSAGRVFQPQNLPSRDLLPLAEIDFGIEAMLLDCEHLIFGDVMKLTVSAVRGVVVAPEGKKLVISDLANIEGRDAAFLAGEEWKLQAFRDYDEGTGPDLYNLSYAKSFRVPHQEVTKTQRQIGKVQELFMQYEGGIGAFLTGAATYGIDLEDMAEKAWPALPFDIVSEAEDYHNWCVRKNRNTYGLKAKTFIVCDSLKRAWRLAHPKIVTLWRGLEDTAIEATQHPGATFTFGRFTFRRDGMWLRIKMPSGRFLCYPSPQVIEGKLTYMGQNQYTRQWCRLKTYGGKLFENVCQSFARDILFDAMPLIEEAGFEIVLHVHDEVVCEAPDSEEYSVDRLSSILATAPEYAAGMPIAAAGFETYRYRKE